MVCHWPGIYFNGEKVGFNILKTIVSRLNQKYNHLTWMKLSEISRYWAAKETTDITVSEKSIQMNAPFYCNDFTLKIEKSVQKLTLKTGQTFNKISNPGELKPNTFFSDESSTILCFNLEKNEMLIKIDED